VFSAGILGRRSADSFGHRDFVKRHVSLGFLGVPKVDRVEWGWSEPYAARVPVSAGFHWATDWMLPAVVAGTEHLLTWTKWTFHCSAYDPVPWQLSRGRHTAEAFAGCNQRPAAVEMAKGGAFVGQHKWSGFLELLATVSNSQDMGECVPTRAVVFGRALRSH
jgi:hypothetical protein